MGSYEEMDRWAAYYLFRGFLVGVIVGSGLPLAWNLLGG